MKKFLLGCTAFAFAVAPAYGQMASVQTTAMTQMDQPATSAVQKIEVNQDGSLTGKVYAKVAGEETPVDAKITLASNGVVIDAVQTENGSFSFANIMPGQYTITGATQGMAGGQSYDVAPYAGTGCSSCNLGLQSTANVVGQGSPMYNAPVSAYGGCGSCGGGIAGGGIGGGGGFGGGGFGGGGGGLLNRRTLIGAGLIGGVIAIAVDDDDDDVSPDQ